jgi:branched-chain amino acid transport system substrate-binding protein
MEILSTKIASAGHSSRTETNVRIAKFLLIAAVAVACQPPGREAQTTASAGDIPVGVYGALSGAEASFGTATVNGVRLAAEEINAAGGVLGRKIKLVVEDDQGRADEAASVVTKLITSDNVEAIIGENSSNQSLAAAPIAQQNKVPMISPSSTNPLVTQKGDYIFRVCFTDPYQGKALAAFVRNNLKLDTAAILLDKKNDYSVGLAEFFGKEFTAAGGKIVASQSYTGGDTEFRPQLTTIRAANPQALFIPGFYTDVGQIAIQARDLGINIPLVGGDGWDSPSVIEIGGRSIENSYFSDHYFVGETRPKVQKFVAEINKRYGRNPEATAALGYDALHIWADAVKRAGSLDRKAVRDQIAATKDYDGVSGTITMGPDRDPIKPVAMIKIENGKMNFAGWVKP